jgi:hypothetical protein
MFDPQELSHGCQDVNRLHIMPSNPCLLATCCDEPQVYVWDIMTAAANSSSRNNSGKDEKGVGGDGDSSSSSGSHGPAACPRAVLAGRTAGEGVLKACWLPSLLVAAEVVEGSSTQHYDCQQGGRTGY